MRESTAWRVLAEAHDAEKGSWFLCNTLKHPDIYPVGLATAPREAMIRRIKNTLEGDGPAYADEAMDGTEERAGRVMACLMFAEQAKDEEKAK